jgi:DNA-binding transcriptional MerR regulator
VVVPAEHLGAEEILAGARISYRQLDYWLRSGVLQNKNPGSGRVRHFSRQEAREILAVADLVRQGVQAKAAGRLVRQAVQDGQYTITISTTMRRLEDDHVPRDPGLWPQAPDV